VSEARVFLVSWDVDRFQAYVYDLPDERLSLHEHMLFDGLSRLVTWEPLPVYSDQPHLAKPDIWYHTALSLPTMNDEVVDQLEPFISRAGSICPALSSDAGIVLEISPN
jgi:hypothetical protein